MLFSGRKIFIVEYMLLLKGYISFRISNWCDNSVFIIHTTKNCVFTFEQVVILLVALNDCGIDLNICEYEAFFILYGEEVHSVIRKYGDGVLKLKCCKTNLKL
jgi:hypothetical protein